MYKQSKIDFKGWGKGGFKMWKFDPYHMANEHRISDGAETGEDAPEAYKVSFDFAEIEDEGVIMLWLGYVDAKVCLPRFKNDSLTVEKYIKFGMQYFKNSKIIIVEPLPQYLESIMRFEGEHEDFSFEDRARHNKIVLAEIRKQVAKYNLPTITQEEIMSCIGVDQLDISHAETNDMHPTDGLKLEYYSKLYDLFIDKANKIAVD